MKDVPAGPVPNPTSIPGHEPAPIFTTSASSIEVSRNSRGYVWSVKIYQRTPEETEEIMIERLYQAEQTLVSLYGGSAER